MARHPDARRRGGRIVAWLLGALLIAGVAVTAWVGVRGLLAYSHLSSARADVAAAARAASGGEVDASAIGAAGSDLRAAHELTSDAIWQAAELVPWIGPQLAALGAVSTAGSNLAGSALGPLAGLASSFSLDAFRPVNGQLDLAGLESLRAAAAEASVGLDAAVDELTSIDRGSVLRPLRENIDQLEDQLTTAATLSQALTVVPSMLGADRPRTWLLLFQNNAELRSLGGMPGATAIVTTADGRLALAGTGTAVMPRFDEPVLDLGPELTAIYGKRPALWFSGTTILPDFAKAAPMAREMWRREHGIAADGVISLDPFALSYLLRATGPVALPTGETLTSGNAVDFLLRQVYLDYPDTGEQNDVFASATAAVFGAFVGGAANPVALVDALADAAEERRLLLWSSKTDEQAVFARAGLAGALPVSDDHVARFGVYLNDGTGSKLGPYLDVDAEVSWERCPDPANSSPGRATLTLTLRNTAPEDAASALPPAIAGGSHGVPAGVLRVVTYVYLPRHASLSSATSSPIDGFGGGADGAYRVLSNQVDLTPGTSSTITVMAALSSAPATTLTAEVTPSFASTDPSATCVARR